MRLSLLVPAVLLGALASGCGDSTPDPNDPSQFQGQYNQGQPGQYQQPQQPGQYDPNYPQQQPGAYQQPGQQPPPQQPAQQPGGFPGMPGMPGQPAQSGGQATPIAPAAAMAATPILTAMASQEVQGMQPDGGAFAGQFQEGQTLEQPINIQPGKCYSVIGVGLGIQELDIQLVAQPAPMLPATVLAQDNTTGAQATLGGRGSCFKNPLPIGGPAKVIVRATRGAGVGVAQVYVK